MNLNIFFRLFIGLLFIQNYLFGQFNFPDTVIVCDTDPVTLQMEYDPDVIDLLDDIDNASFTSLSLGDDEFSSIINIGFTFTFYGNNYTQCLLSSNNYISFNTVYSGQSSPFNITSSLPNSSSNTDDQKVRNSILAPWQDIDPGAGGTLDYATVGTAPNRVFVIRWLDVPMFSCTSLSYCSAILLYENGDVIETHIANKPICSTWNNGYAIHGLQNSTGTTAEIVTDPTTNNARNYPNTWTANLEGVRFTPSGTTDYTVSFIDFIPVISLSTLEWTDANGTLLNTGSSYVWSPSGSTANSEYIYVESSVCSTNLTDTILLITDPEASILPPPNLNCIGPDDSLSISIDYADSVVWSTGETGNTIQLTGLGTYSAEIFIDDCIFYDTVNIQSTNPIIDLGPDLTFCEGDSVILDATTSGATYLWQDGSTSPTITVSESGTYTVEVTANGCISTDSVEVTVNNYSSFDFGPDQIICQGQVVVLSGYTPGATYLWNNGTTNSYQSVTTAGTYILEVNLNGCVRSDTIEITVIPGPEVDLGPDQSICEGDSVFLDALSTLPNVSYLWQDGSTGSSFTAYQSGLYYVEVDNGACTDSDSIQINVTPAPAISLGPDTSICSQDQLILDASTTGADYLWQDGSTNATILADQTGWYTVEVSIGTCSSTDSIYVTVEPSPIINLGPDLDICEGDSVYLDANFPGANYLWNTGSTNSGIWVGQSGDYSVELNLNGCIFSDTVTVNVNSYANLDLGPDTVLCEGQLLTISEFTPGATYLWQDGSTNSSLTISQTGLYILTVTLNGCSITDSVQITFDPSPVIELGPDLNICQGDSVLLDAFFAGASYSWQDGSSNSSYWASQSGTYTVNLELNGCTFTDSIDITVNNYPNFDLGPDTTLCQGQTLTLSGFSPGANYLWQDGNTNSSYLVNQAGLYILEVDLNGCSTTDSIQVNFSPIPSINLGANQSICEGDSLLLNAFYPGATYLWQDGSTNSDYLVTVSGTYSVELTLNECTYQDQISIDVNEYPDINLGNDTTLCEGETLQLNASYPGATYLWQDGSNSAIYNVSQTGTYSVQVNNDGCIGFDTIVVNVLPNPVIDLGPDQQLCEGDMINLNAFYPGASYQWNTGSTNSNIDVQNTGIYIVTLELNGCQFQDMISVTFNPIPEISLEETAEICAGESYTLDASYPNPNASYLWQDGSDNAIFNAQNEGWQIVTVELDGCSYTDSTYLTVHDLPESPLEDTSICLGESFLFNAYTADAISYEWADGSTQSSLLADEEGWYSVTISNINCSVVDSAYLSVNTVPLFGLPEDTFLCEGEPLIFEFDPNNANYLWQDQSTSSSYTINELGIYTLTISNGCGTSDFYMEVHPADCQCVLYVPNAFSPNNGGINEVFTVFPECELSDFELSIFNRWGKRVFHTEDPTESWDGTIDGDVLPQDVYLYQVQYAFDGEDIFHNDQGVITLLR